MPVFRSGNKICIGYPRKKQYLEIEYNQENYDLLKQIICAGIEKIQLSDFLYGQLNKFNFLEKLIEYKDAHDCDRDELYFDYLGNSEYNKELKETKILVFGAGAFGSTIIYKLAQSGFKNIIAIDFDEVNRTDTLKSFVFRMHDVGQKKVAVLKKRIKEQFNIEIKIKNAEYLSLEAIEKVVSLHSPDIILKACDPILTFRVHLNQVAFKYKIPFLNFAYAFEILRLGPFYIPGITSCDEYLNQMQKKHYGKHYDFLSDKKMFTNYLAHPATSFNVSMLAAFALKEILMFLTKQYESCVTIGRLIEFNPLSLQYNYFEIKCDDTCKICNKNNLK